VSDEAAADPDRACEWSADQRLRLERLYAAYGLEPAVPLECLQTCPAPPTLALHRQAWEAAVFSWGAACKRLHDDCVAALR